MNKLFAANPLLVANEHCKYVGLQAESLKVKQIQICCAGIENNYWSYIKTWQACNADTVCDSMCKMMRNLGFAPILLLHYTQIYRRILVGPD